MRLAPADNVPAITIAQPAAGDRVLIFAECDTTTGTYIITPHLYGAVAPAEAQIPTTDVEEIECVAEAIS